MTDATTPAPPTLGPEGAPPALAALVRERLLDAELAATAWILIESGVPVIVAGRRPVAGSFLEALLVGVALGTHLAHLAGADEDFAWLPHAYELGWAGQAKRSAQPPKRAAQRPAQPAATRLVGDFGEDATWGERARIAVRAASIGYALAATVDADSLEGVFHVLRGAPNHIAADELSRLGLVLILGEEVTDGQPRVTAAHYVRPLARDEHGHVQRLGPAVLATHDPTTDRFEHFGWGIMPELAARIGWRPGDLELEIDRRRQILEPSRRH